MGSGEITRTLHEKILRPAVKNDIMIIEKRARENRNGDTF